MKQIVSIFVLFLSVLFLTNTMRGQVSGNVPDGTNRFTLSGSNARADSINSTFEVGRDIFLVEGPNSLDGDNLADLVVTDYRNGGRVLVFEQDSKSSLNFHLVFKSDSLGPLTGGGSSPRTLTVGDFDNNGKLDIIFPVGRLATDSTRGLYIYEWDGIKDNGYRRTAWIKPEEIDTLYRTARFGRVERQGLLATDVDKDGKTELLIGSFEFTNFTTDATLYILQVESGTFAQNNAKLKVEYKYKKMAYITPDSSDGYIPAGFAVGDLDNDGKNEIIVLGRVNVSTGSGIGFIDVPGPNQYVDGSIVEMTPVGGTTIFARVSALPALVSTPQGTIVYLLGETDNASSTPIAPRELYVIDNITDVSFVGKSDVKLVAKGYGVWAGLAAGDQDHGLSKDGFDVYIPGSNEIIDAEYKGTGSLADSNSYTFTRYSLTQLLRNPSGAITKVIVPKADLNANGRKEVITGYQAFGGDSIITPTGIQPLKGGQLVFFIFEWGDSTTKVVTSVADENSLPIGYSLDQNYPNPFNPSTTIKFSLPKSGPVMLRIFDVNGREVRTLAANKNFDAGDYKVEWDGKSNDGRAVSSGTYFYTLEAGSYTNTRKMVLLK